MTALLRRIWQLLPTLLAAAGLVVIIVTAVRYEIQQTGMHPPTAPHPALTGACPSITGQATYSRPATGGGYYPIVCGLPTVGPDAATWGRDLPGGTDVNSGAPNSSSTNARNAVTGCPATYCQPNNPNPLVPAQRHGLPTGASK